VLGKKNKEIETIWGKNRITIEESTQDGTRIKIKS
jgi:hypothetical protein